MPDYLTPCGPFETPDDVHQAAADLRDALRRADAAVGDEFRRLRIDAAAHHVISTLTACGVELGAEDERTVRWMAAVLDQPEITVLLDWIRRARQAATPPAMAWVLYRAENGCDILSPAGIEGCQDTPVGPVELAVAKLSETTTEHPSWAVKVFDANCELLAWAQWERGEAVGYLAEQDGGDR